MKALIYGGSGALGRALVSRFADTWKVANVDFLENSMSHSNILLPSGVSANNQVALIKEQLGDEKFDCIVCAAGGWTGGSIKDGNFLESYEEMNQKNLIPALISCHLATRYLNREGLLVLTGASTVFSGPTPSMIGYALAKTGVHTLALNSFGSVLPQDGAIVTILPYMHLFDEVRETIDTESNRQAMPTADFSTWAKPEQISGLIRGWAEGLNRPITGSMVHLRVKSGVVVPEFV